MENLSAVESEAKRLHALFPSAGEAPLVLEQGRTHLWLPMSQINSSICCEPGKKGEN